MVPVARFRSFSMRKKILKNVKKNLARLKKSCQVPLNFVKLRFNAIRYVLVVQMRDQRAGLPATFKFQQ